MMNRPVNKLRITTLNIRHGADSSGKLQLDLIGKALRKTDSDVICLQEVDVYTKRSGNVDQAQALAAHLNCSAEFSMAQEYDGGQYGIAVLTNDEFLDSTTCLLPALSERTEPRIAMAIRVSGGYGIGNTHLSRNSNEAYKQATELFQLFPSWVEIICGDFNIGLENVPFDHSKWLSVFSPEDEPPTWPIDNPKESIDHILVTKMRWNVVSVKTLSTLSSDHLGIVADLERKL